jgi:hypothetical protein
MSRCLSFRPLSLVHPGAELHVTLQFVMLEWRRTFVARVHFSRHIVIITTASSVKRKVNTQLRNMRRRSSTNWNLSPVLDPQSWVLNLPSVIDIGLVWF